MNDTVFRLKLVKILFVLGVLTSLSNPYKGQTLEPTFKNLTITKADKSKIVKMNRKVKIYFKDSSKAELKGRLQAVNEDHIIVGNQIVKLEEIDKMRVPNLGVRIVGGILAVPGSFFLGVGIALIGYGLSNQIEDGLAALAGVLVIVVSILPTMAGYSLMMSGKMYRTHKGWEFGIQ